MTSKLAKNVGNSEKKIIESGKEENLKGHYISKYGRQVNKPDGLHL